MRIINPYPEGFLPCTCLQLHQLRQTNVYTIKAIINMKSKNHIYQIRNTEIDALRYVCSVVHLYDQMNKITAVGQSRNRSPYRPREKSVDDSCTDVSYATSRKQYEQYNSDKYSMYNKTSVIVRSDRQQRLSMIRHTFTND